MLIDSARFPVDFGGAFKVLVSLFFVRFWCRRLCGWLCYLLKSIFIRSVTFCCTQNNRMCSRYLTITSSERWLQKQCKRSDLVEKQVSGSLNQCYCSFIHPNVQWIDSSNELIEKCVVLDFDNFLFDQMRYVVHLDWFVWEVGYRVSFVVLPIDCAVFCSRKKEKIWFPKLDGWLTFLFVCWIS